MPIWTWIAIAIAVVAATLYSQQRYKKEKALTRKTLNALVPQGFTLINDGDERAEFLFSKLESFYYGIFRNPLFYSIKNRTPTKTTYFVEAEFSPGLSEKDRVFQVYAGVLLKIEYKNIPSEKEFGVSESSFRMGNIQWKPVVMILSTIFAVIALASWAFLPDERADFRSMVYESLLIGIFTLGVFYLLLTALPFYYRKRALQKLKQTCFNAYTDLMQIDLASRLNKIL